MALSYFGLQLGSLTLAVSLAWILSSFLCSQVGSNLEHFSSCSTSLIQPQAKLSCFYKKNSDF